MRRGIFLGVLVAVGGLSITVASYQAQRPQIVKIADIQKVRDNLYVILGGDPRDLSTFSGSNTAVFITDAGVVLIDTKVPGYGQAILEKVRSVTEKPVTMIINTHTHGDHTGSNSEFPSTVEVVAQENTKANMAKMDMFKGDASKFLPKRTFKERMSLFSGKDRIDLYYFGRGHTNGDTFVVFPAVRAVATGDLFQLKWVPNIDVDNGGSGVAWSQTLTKALAGIKNVDTVIPGHSPLTTLSAVQEHADFHKDFVKIVQDGMKAGQNVDEIASAFKLPAKYTTYTADPGMVKRYVQAVYDELKK
jgi:glyoxylase-like metal-dependent hydrolase (beta-lactamase superfamily II)